MNGKNCYGTGHSDAPVLPSLRRTWPLEESGGHSHANNDTPDEVASMSKRLFGQVIQLGTQVCQGPCVGNDTLAFAFAGSNG